MEVITGAEFTKFFEEKKSGTYRCPVCNTEEFLINSADVEAKNESPVAPLVFGPNDAHKFLSITCANCGHSDFFHFNQFKKWKQTQTSKGGT
jgi:predicted nucleic-acid-binding Zn-ribbon protein